MAKEELKSSINESFETLGLSKGKLLCSLKSFFAEAYKYAFIILVFILIGVYIGISTSRVYYNSKIKEVITIGAFLYQDKVYQISSK